MGDKMILTLKFSVSVKHRYIDLGLDIQGIDSGFNLLCLSNKSSLILTRPWDSPETIKANFILADKKHIMVGGDYEMVPY